MGIYNAFKLLNYSTIHILDLMQDRANFATHINGLTALLEAEMHYPGSEPFTKPDFERWWAQYEVLVEVPSMCPSQLVPAYIDDPDVRFLLVERDPDAWARSFDAFIGKQWIRLNSFPMNVLQMFNPKLRAMNRFAHVMYEYYGDGRKFTVRDVGAPGVQSALSVGYAAYITRVKALVPSERLHVIKLEDGLGWEELCGFLGCPVPEGVPYPEKRGHEEAIAPLWRKTLTESLTRVGPWVVPALAAATAVWWGVRKPKVIKGMMGLVPGVSKGW